MGPPRPTLDTRAAIAGALLAAALLVAAPASAERTIQLYEVRYRAAAELLPLAEAALQPEGWRSWTAAPARSC